MILNWKTTKADAALISDIAARAVAIARTHKLDYSMQDAMMDITAAHCNGCRLDLQRLSAAPEFDFVHDVFGIRRHIDRDTGKLQDCFVPRFAAR